MINKFEVQGVVTEISELQTGTKSSGGKWNKLEIQVVLQSPKTKQNHYYKIMFWNRTAEYAFNEIKVNDMLEIEGQLSSFEYKGYHNLQLVATKYNVTQSGVEQQTAPDFDDIPF